MRAVGHMLALPPPHHSHAFLAVNWCRLQHSSQVWDLNSFERRSCRAPCSRALELLLSEKSWVWGVLGRMVGRSSSVLLTGVPKLQLNCTYWIQVRESLQRASAWSPACLLQEDPSHVGGAEQTGGCPEVCCWSPHTGWPSIALQLAAFWYLEKHSRFCCIVLSKP